MSVGLYRRQAQRRAGEITSKCLAVCRNCTDASPPGMGWYGVTVRPFDDPTKRNAWMRDHATTHGHVVKPVDGWPPPREAYRTAFGSYPSS
jgi:hypothetical protein